MKKDPALANAFMDIVLAGAVVVTISLIVDIVNGGNVNLYLVGGGVVMYGAYLIAAIRLGVSPIAYLRSLTKRRPTGGVLPPSEFRSER